MATRAELLESMVARIQAALDELQTVAHDARSSGLLLEDLHEVLGLLVRVRDGLAVLGQALRQSETGN